MNIMGKFDNKLILIIDDNSMNLLLTSKILENYGFRTITAESGLLGIEEIEKEMPALILLDIMMPDMNGYEVCKKIKEVEKWIEIPIIFLTANSKTDDLVEGFSSGGVDYITKPFKSEELIVRVNNHLELSAAKKTIVEMNRNRDKLYSIIAHDIRSPLSGILQTIDAIDQGYFDPCSNDFKDIIKHLRIRTKDTSTLLNSLLQWTRLQSDTVEIVKTNVNIHDLISNCIQLLDANASNKNITVSLQIPINDIAWIDEVSIHTVFRNLLSNAIKFTPVNGNIKIFSELSTGFLNIIFEDDGVGMSEGTIQKIFEKQEHHTTNGTENEQGTGLGLMLVKDFIKKNSGVLQVDSKVGSGTRFTISLPLPE